MDKRLTVRNVLSYLQANDVILLITDRGTIRWSAPIGVISPRIRKFIARHSLAIIIRIYKCQYPKSLSRYEY